MPLSYHELVALAKQEIDEITVDELVPRLGQALLLDVREPEEFRLGTIPGAVLVPHGVIEGAMSRVAPDPETEIVVFCAVGNRSALAARDLKHLGYTSVTSLAGGIALWHRMGHPVAVPGGVEAERMARYSRHLVLPGVGEAGQQRLLDARVAVVGAGGLGSPALLYLAAAGVGTIGVIDDDVVAVENLQRQILHDTPGVGTAKVASAVSRIGRLNPDVALVSHAARLDASNALAMLDGYDLIVDGSDNFPTRYLLNDASLHLEIPVVHGSVFRWEGQVSVFTPYEGPCYRCLFPLPPPPELAPDCETAGVLGALPGVVGSIMAVETLKLVLGVGEPLVGTLLTYDALGHEFIELRLDRDPACAACADRDRKPVLIDYDEACRPG